MRRNVGLVWGVLVVVWGLWGQRVEARASKPRVAAVSAELAMASLFPKRSLAVVLAKRAGEGLPRLWQTLQTYGPEVLSEADVAAWKASIVGDLELRQSVDSAATLWRAMGLSEQGAAGVALLYSKLMATVGTLWVAKVRRRAALHKVLRGETGRRLAQPFWRACQRRMRYYAGRLRREFPRYRRKKTLSFRDIRRVFRGASFLRWCALMRPCRWKDGRLQCRRGATWHPPVAWFRLHWRGQSWSEAVIPGGRRFGSVRQGFFYVIVRGGVAMVSSHPYFLVSALRGRRLRRKSLAAVLRGFAPGASMQVAVLHQNVRRMLRAQRVLPAKERMVGLRVVPRWGLRWLVRLQRGLEATQAMLFREATVWRWKGRLRLTRRSRYRQTRAVAPRPLDHKPMWVPPGSRWVLGHHALRALARVVGPQARRAFSRRGLLLSALQGQLGRRMTLSVVPASEGPPRLLLQMELAGATWMRRWMGSLPSLFPGMGRVRTTLYRGRTIYKHNSRAAQGTSLSFMVRDNRLLLALEVGRRDSTFLQTVLDRHANQAPSPLALQTVQQGLRRLGMGQAFVYRAANAPSDSEPSSRPSTAPSQPSRPGSTTDRLLGGLRVQGASSSLAREVSFSLTFAR